MMFPLRQTCATFLLGVVACALSLHSVSQSRAIEIEFRLACELDSSCSAGNFFVDHPEALAALEFAGQAYAPFSDQLTSLNLSSATFTHPLTGQHNFAVANLDVAQNALIIYVGGRDLPVGRVGEASVGGSATAFGRGQGIVEGLAASDFAPWGGSIAFDTHDEIGNLRPWHFESGTQAPPGQIDFYSVAVHELGHIFGFGTADSFANLISDHHFIGAEAIDLYGGAVPTFESTGHITQHWDDGLTSPPAENEPRVALSRVLFLGRRTLLTPLDYAAFADIGWQVPDQLLGLHGNFKVDTRVDGGDFLEWQRSLSGVGQVAIDDPPADLQSANYDLWLWSQNFGSRLAAAQPLGTVVPEPASWVMLLALFLCHGRWSGCPNRNDG